MEKTAEFEVFELQELVHEHNCGRERTSLEQKSIIVKAHLLNHMPRLCIISSGRDIKGLSCNINY